jgi:hypothetical protein
MKVRLLALVAGGLLLTGILATSASADGATQITDGSFLGTVYAFDATPSNPTVFGGVGRLHDVLAPSGQESETFQLDGVPNPTGQAVQIDGSGGLLCISLITFRLTTDFHETISASGQATLVCKFS